MIVCVPVPGSGSLLPLTDSPPPARREGGVVKERQPVTGPTGISAHIATVVVKGQIKIGIDFVSYLNLGTFEFFFDFTEGT